MIKKCPVCERTYSDESISFCLADGALLSAPEKTDAAPTAVLPSSLRPTEQSKQPALTPTMTSLTPPEPVLPVGADKPPRLPRTNPLVNLGREILFPLIAVIAAFIVGGVVILIIGDSPIQTYKLLIGSAFSWPDGIGYTLFNATPLIFTGLAVAVAFRCGLLNIGAEGQLYVASFVCAWVGITCTGLPGVLLVPLCMLAAIVAGGVWGGIPGVLRARFGAHEVITTIMLNFVGIALASWATQYHYKPPGDALLETVPVAAQDHLARLGRFVPGLP